MLNVYWIVSGNMEKKIKVGKVILLFCCFNFCATNAQIIVDDSSHTVKQLIEDVLIDSPCASVDKIQSSTSTHPDFNGIGYFEANNSGFEIDKGVILSTGHAMSAAGPNGVSPLSEGDGIGWGGDNDLSTITSTGGLSNATSIQFEFTPTINFISFDFLFASEEYIENFPCTFSDVFAFILTNVSTGVARNLAVVPNTNPPTPIKVTTVHDGVDLNGDGDFTDATECAPQNPNYFNKRNAPGTNSAIDFNGYTKVLTASGSVIPNEKYKIKLVIADSGDGQFDSAVFLAAGTFNFGGDIGDDRTIANDNPGCIGTSIVLDATVGINSTYIWTKNGAPLSAGDGTTLLTGGSKLEVTQNGVYGVEINISNKCLTTDSVTIEFVSPPNVSNVVTLSQCDNDTDGFSLFNLTEANSLVSNNFANQTFSYYLTEQQAIAGKDEDKISNFKSYPNPTLLNSVVFVRTESAHCFETSQIDLQVSATQIPSDFNLTYTICEKDDDDPTDGITAFDFSDATDQIKQQIPTGQNLIIKYYQNEADALSEENEITDISNYRNDSSPGTQHIYVRVENSVANSCLGLGRHITLIAHPLIPTPIEDEYTMCLREDDSIIDLLPTDQINTGLSTTDYTFQWYTGNATTTENEIIGETGSSFSPEAPGIYTVLTINKLTNCSQQKSTKVIKSYPPESVATELLSGAFSDNAKIKVTVVGNGQYEYKIDNGNWQESNIFANVSIGQHTVYVRDLRMCDEIQTEVETVVGYPEYFTPNGDGFHEDWTIEGSINVTILDITVFDRYGKLLSHLGATGIWDGTYNGEVLPSSDYWFKVQYIEEGITKEYKNSFSLIR